MQFSIGKIFPVVTYIALVVRAIEVHGWQPLTLAWILTLSALVLATVRQVMQLWQGNLGLFAAGANRVARRTWLLIRLFGAAIVFTGLIGVGQFPGLKDLFVFRASQPLGWPQEILGLGICFCLLPLWHRAPTQSRGGSRFLDLIVKGALIGLLGMFLLTFQAHWYQLLTIHVFGIEQGFPLRWASGLRESAYDHFPRQREFAVQAVWGLAAMLMLALSMWSLLTSGRFRLFWLLVWILGLGLAVKHVYWVHSVGYDSLFASDTGSLELSIQTSIDLGLYLMLGLGLALVFAPAAKCESQPVVRGLLLPYQPQPWICWTIIFLSFFQVVLWEFLIGIWTVLKRSIGFSFDDSIPFGVRLPEGSGTLGYRIEQYLLDDPSNVFGLAPNDYYQSLDDYGGMLGVIWMWVVAGLCLANVRWWEVIRSKNWFLRTLFLSLALGAYFVFMVNSVFQPIPYRWNPELLTIIFVLGVIVWSLFFLKRTPKPTLDADAVVEVVLRQSADGWLLPRAGLLAVTIGALWLTILWVMAAAWPDNFWNEWLGSFGR